MSFLVHYVQGQTLPVWNDAIIKYNKPDWLVHEIGIKAQVFTSADGKDLILYNGLLKRVFRITPNLACTSYQNLSNGRELLRSVKAEVRLTINGRDYNVGGLSGQRENAYLAPAELNGLKAGANDFQFVNYTVAPVTPYLNWKTRFWMPAVKPATGKVVSFIYKAGAPELAGLKVAVNYELYDNIPLIVKSVTIENEGSKTYKINQVVNEILGMVEEESAVEGSPGQYENQPGDLHRNQLYLQ